MFNKNQIYRRQDIHSQYSGQEQGGISTPREHPIIFIWTEPDSDQQDVYVDKWENDYFYFSGQGRRGDMLMNGNNKSILEHELNGKEIHLFEKTSESGMWKYIDELKLVDLNYYRNDDEDGKDRQSFQFVLLSKSKESNIKFSNEDKENNSRYNYNRPNITERRGLVTSRVGQGYYRRKLLDKWNSKCSITGVGITKILICSHIVPWRDSNDDERLDEDNGILLTPNLDGLFDKYLISFDNNGKIIFSETLDKNELNILGINSEMRISSLNSRMKNYLKRHREKFYEQEN
jgi:5-methylcytosine-specific restriction enzyme A